MKFLAEYLPQVGTCLIAADVDDLKDNKVIVEGAYAYVGPRRIRLPVSVPSTSFVARDRHISARIRGRTALNNAKSTISADGEAPWSAQELNSNQQQPLLCRHCSEPIVDANIRWRQLPSEHWAELMDLWHCHKPHKDAFSEDGHEEPESMLNGLYTSGKFIPSEGNAFVSDAYFLVAPENRGECPHLPIGDGEKLWKWDVRRLHSPIIGVETFFAAILRELVDAHGIYTYNFGSSLLVWVLSLHTIFSVDGSGPKEGLKILWTKNMELRDTRPDVEDVYLPQSGIDRLQEAVEASNAALPASATAVGQWSVAFLGERLL